jgi:hypothetical protein
MGGDEGPQAFDHLGHGLDELRLAGVAFLHVLEKLLRGGVFHLDELVGKKKRRFFAKSPSFCLIVRRRSRNLRIHGARAHGFGTRHAPIWVVCEAVLAPP